MLFSFTCAQKALSVSFTHFYLNYLVGNNLAIKKNRQKSSYPRLTDIPHFFKKILLVDGVITAYVTVSKIFFINC